MKLDVIEEIHPANIVGQLFTNSHLGMEADQRISGYFRPNSRISPFFIVSDRFWNYLYKNIRDQLKERQETGSPIIPWGLHGREEFRELSELMVKQLEITRAIWGEEAHLLSNGKYKGVYLETPVACPLDAIARSNGKGVVYLDGDNPFYDFLRKLIYSGRMNGEDYERGQKEREGEWVRRMESLGNSVMICGDNHRAGKFGLASRLSNRGIDIRTIRSFVDYRSQVETNFAQMQQIQSTSLVALKTHHTKF